MSMALKLPSGVRWSGQLLLTIALCLVAVVFVVRDGLPVLIAVVRPAADPSKVDVTTPLLAQHQETQAINRKRLEGRYLFFPPPDWKRIPKVVVRPPVPDTPVAPPPPPPPPAEYSGFRPIGMLGSTVFFEGGRSIELGKESEGVTVVEVVSSWQLKLRHKDKTYDVSFGVKPSDDLFKPAPPRTSVPGITSTPVTGPASTSGPAAVAGASSTPRPAGAASAAIAPPGAREGDTPAAAPAAAPGAAPAAAPGVGSLRTPPPAEGAAPAAPGAPIAPPSPEAGQSGASVAPAGGEGAQAPPALTEGEVQGMTKEAAKTALQQVARTLATGGASLDATTRSRLKQEQQWLSQRLRQH